ncbi:hypothetical protein AAF712_008939 [Marasmius tenuissimus]|uniref:Uncharacterized protein n=1 Tax=Marasmius tenuissimus TaxID=585030 RepID=A0ABR2ZQX3_9AGAR|nr:hypothetical protein PM082_006811 [Marasmius tenuissimus]
MNRYAEGVAPPFRQRHWPALCLKIMRKRRKGIKELDEADVHDDEVEAVVKDENETLESVEEVEADDAKYDESSGADADMFLRIDDSPALV